MIKLGVVLSLLFLLVSNSVLAQNKVVILPMGEGDESQLMPLLIPEPAQAEPDLPEADQPPTGLLRDALPKPMIFNKGWDQTLNNEPEIDPTVHISLSSIEPVFGYHGILFTANEITHWGQQTFWSGGIGLYAKGVILVDKGETLEGGPFEWSRNQQGHMSFHNILRTDYPATWILNWTDPNPGDTVWFFLISDDEKYSSNPITFTWPG